MERKDRNNKDNKRIATRCRRLDGDDNEDQSESSDQRKLTSQQPRGGDTKNPLTPSQHQEILPPRIAAARNRYMSHKKKETDQKFSSSAISGDSPAQSTTAWRRGLRRSSAELEEKQSHLRNSNRRSVHTSNCRTSAPIVKGGLSRRRNQRLQQHQQQQNPVTQGRIRRLSAPIVKGGLRRNREVQPAVRHQGSEDDLEAQHSSNINLQEELEVGATWQSSEDRSDIGSIQDDESLVNSMEENHEENDAEVEDTSYEGNYAIHIAPHNTMDDDESLVVATRVPEEEEPSNRQVAEFVDPLVSAERSFQRRKKSLCCAMKFILAAFTFIAGLALMLGFVLSQRRESSQVFATSNNTKLPPSDLSSTTSSPSAAPTGAIDPLLRMIPNYSLSSLKDPNSPQSRAFLWLSNHPNISGLPDWRMVQLFSLATFYYSFQGEHWPPPLGNNGWLDGLSSECYWYTLEHGAFVRNGKYVDLGEWLSDNPNAVESICNPSKEIRFLALGHLNLANYTPKVPPEISLLTSLEEIRLGYNNIQAPLSDLMPSQLSELPKLRRFLLAHNGGITGTIPDHLDSYLKQIDSLELEGNKLHGVLPSAIGLLTALTHLSLFNNSLSGALPSELGGQLTGLRSLTLRQNQFDSIPTQIGLLKNLTGLDLFNNSAKALPTELGLLTDLKRLDISHNALTGWLPSEVFRMMNLTQLNFSHNNLSGACPSEVGLLQALKQLDLSHNLLSNSIPSELGLLTSLPYVDFSTNRLNSSLPSEVGMLTGLRYLFLNDNVSLARVSSCAFSRSLQLSFSLSNPDMNAETDWDPS